MLALNLLSFAAHHLLHHGTDPSLGVLVHVGLFSWFLLDYLFFERVHLYTYDLFAERVGFKLGFGCLTFYPYFYAVGLWTTADRPSPHAPAWLLGVGVVLFFCGWILARGANMQKFFFKLDPRQSFLGIAPQVVSNGERTLLCSGFWGVARHVNYLGEILMATGLALVLGWPTAVGPWLYPLYYVALLIPRERDDHRRCAAKYGALWDEYCRRVRYRIVPGLY
jgi:delta14-sterol reductase